MKWRGIIAILGCLATSYMVLADRPKLGGLMKHLFIGLDGTAVFTAHEYEPNAAVVLYQYPEDVYDPPADVLNDTYYSARYGWLAAGFISIPRDAGIFVQVVEQSPELSVYDEFTFEPLFGTLDSSLIWQWSGRMVHNWYAVDGCGHFRATYEVYVGQADGTPYPGFTSDEITLRFWAAVPVVEAADTDVDSDIDLHDLAELQRCVGEVVPSEAGCDCLDVDGSQLVDMADVEAVLDEVEGPLET